MRRVLRGLGALLALAVLLAGAPLLLLAVGQLPDPAGWSPTALWAVLSSPDDGSFLVSVLTVVGWLAWLVVLLSTLAEVVSLLRGRRLRLPGLSLPQHLVRGLLLAVLALAVVPGALAEATPPTEGPVAVTPAHVQQPPPRAAPSEQDAAEDQLVHEVVAGDDLWSLATHYYGDGSRWRRIAEANPDRLTGGPDHLETGWRLVLPGATKPPTADRRTVTVLAGDTLSGLAEAHLGDAERWPELVTANRASLPDPDQLPVGAVLTLPPAGTAPAGTAPTNPSLGADQRGADQARADDAEDRRRAEQAQQEHERQLREDEERRRLDRAGPPTGDAPHEPPQAGDPVDPEPRPGPSGTPGPGPSGPGTSRPGPSGPATSETGAPETSTARAGTPEQLDEMARIGIVGSTGGLLAAALVGGVAHRRAVQLATRPPGRQLPVPSGPAQLVRSALGQHQETLSTDQLGWVQRAVARHCTGLGVPVPPLRHVLVAPDRITVVHETPEVPPPPGFESQIVPVGPAVSTRLGTWSVTVESWRQAGVGPDEAVEDDQPVAWPALVSLGRVPLQDAGEADDAHLLVCLQRLGLTAVLGPPPVVESAMSALMMELGCHAWAGQVATTLVGPAGIELAEATELTHLVAVPELEPELERQERRWAAQRAEQSDPQVRRLMPEADTAWAPTVLLLSVQPTLAQSRRLRQLLAAGAPLAVVSVGSADRASSVLTLSHDGTTAQLERAGQAPTPLAPQLVEADVRAAVLELMRVSGATRTAPAPWWPATSSSAPVDDPTLVRLPTRAAGWKEADAVTGPPGGALASSTDPTVLLLGVIELVGARGAAPSRAVKQCIEYCAWLLEHPGRTAPAMASSLVVAEGTRRSNMSRLRRWLGTGEDGEPYLPDAYSGRIALHHGVGSDLDELRMLVAGGVPAAPTEHLVAALALVRGAPLADAAPGQWGWAEELRIEVLCTLRDVALVVTGRALETGDLDLARWAAARGLTVSPDDERLLAARLRTEHRAGNQAEVERLARRLTRQAKLLEVDLDEDTVALLQQVMEGRIRAREA